MPAPRADPTNTFLARHIIDPGTEYTNMSLKSGCKHHHKSVLIISIEKSEKKIKQYDKMITHTVQEQLKEQQNQNGIYSF